MPLRDHFRPPTDLRISWEELHGGWPMTIVQHLRTLLPAGYTAGPKVHHGAHVEVDVSAYEGDDVPRFGSTDAGGVATLAWAPAEPSLAVETELTDFDEYEVRVYDARRERRLVAAIEIVSPANKDRPEHRNTFVAKCAALLRQGIAVSVVDLVTTKHFNLYAELLEFIGHIDPTLPADPPDISAAACRFVRVGKKTVFQAWSHTLTVGERLPTLPLWLTAELVVPLDLEVSYEKACHDLWLT